MARKTKHEKLQAHLEAVKQLRQEVAEAERKATRKRHDQLATAVTEMGLDQVILDVAEPDRQRIGKLAAIGDRLRELYRVLDNAQKESPTAPPTASQPTGA